MAVSQKTTPEISVIIINYNTPQLVLKLVSSLESNEIEIIVVDNSDVNTIENKLRSNIGYFYMNENTGFAKAANFGAKKASSDWVFFLNSDTSTTTGDILKLLEITKKEKALVAAPKLVNDDIVENNVGTFDNIMKNPVNLLFLRPHFADCSKIRTYGYYDLVTAGALLIQKRVFEEMNGFDEQFFMYFEDIDLSYRLFKKKYRILYVPEVVIRHASGSSSRDVGKKSAIYSGSLGIFLRKNRGLLISTINNVFKFLR